MFEIEKSPLEGCFALRPKVFTDARGTFVKTFHKSTFEGLGLETNFRESFYSISNANVIRGLHFQVPPHDHVKLVTCTEGEVIDVVLDLRKFSPTYGKVASFKITPENGLSVYIPKGMAHGFYSVKDRSTVTYSVSTEHHAAFDRGLLWSSIDFEWPTTSPIVSERDSKFPSLKDFESPFSCRRLNLKKK